MEFTGMNEQRAREILEQAIIIGEAIGEGYLSNRKIAYMGGDAAILTGGFKADELEAIAFWMRREQK